MKYQDLWIESKLFFLPQ